MTSADVVWREVLWGVFSTLGRLRSLANCRRADPSRYCHEQVTAALGAAEGDHALRLAHELAWSQWMSGSLEQQQADLLLHLCDFQEDLETLLVVWSKAQPYLKFVPDSAREEERILFTTNLSVLLGLLRNQYCLKRPRVFPEAENTLMNQALQILREEYTDPDLSIGCLAKRLHKSHRQISRLFKHCTNYNFRNYLGALRMEKAVGLITSSTHDVKAIAGMVGYRDASYFSRDFRDRIGCTPKEFRAKTRMSEKGGRFVLPLSPKVISAAD